MISLQDEIKKFEELVYNSQLEEFVTVDQMFAGGGITMESIIQESNFIVYELKKMNSVFRNFCKLNEKVYEKITEHELNVHSEQARVNALAGSVDRKMEEGMKTFKEIHEDTISQNQKSYTAMMEQLDPIKKDIEQKVDQATFSRMVKKLLEENQDEEEIQESNEEGIQENSEGVKVQGGSLGRAPDSPYPKKKGKLSFDEFYRFREQLDAKLKTNDQQLTLIQKQGIESKTLLSKHIPEISSLSEDNSLTKSTLHKLQVAQRDTTYELNQQISKVTSELNRRLNDEVWKDKFQTFNEKQIKPIIQKINDSLKVYQVGFEKNKEETVQKFKDLDAEILKGKSQGDISKRNIAKIEEEMHKMKDLTAANKSAADQQHFTLSKDLQLLSQETKTSSNKLETRINKELNQLRQGLESIMKTVSEAVVKIVSKRFDLQLKAIDKNIRDNAEATRQVRIDVGIVEQEIKNIKNILAQKANFSDFVQHVEKKADKEDFKELQVRLHQTSQQLASRKMNQSMNLSIRLDRSNSHSNKKIPSVNKITNTSKTMMAPHTAHHSEKQNFDSGTKMFMCGMEGHLNDTRKSWTQSSRRRNQKSSTAIVSDFLI